MPVPVLHCYADYKWTGPSEPVVQLCVELARRGWRSDLICRSVPPGQEEARSSFLPARARELGLTVRDDCHFDGGLRVGRAISDIRHLRRLVTERGYRIVHCHGSWDHIIAGLALGRRGVPIVRTDHRARKYRRCKLLRCYYGRPMADHLIVISEKCRVWAVDRVGLAPEQVSVVRGAVDTEFYRPMTPPAGVWGRFGRRHDDFVFVVVARVQPHRRFDVLLKAACIVQARNESVKIAVLGRGTRRRQLLDEPVERMGLSRTVFPLGYVKEGYREALAMCDAGLMLVPGSDGTCRAAMQMAAMGKPLLVAQRGVLPDIVFDGRTGIVVNDTPENLAQAMLTMAGAPGKCLEWGASARRRMAEQFSLARQADGVEEVYRRLLAGREAIV